MPRPRPERDRPGRWNTQSGVSRSLSGQARAKTQRSRCWCCIIPLPPLRVVSSRPRLLHTLYTVTAAEPRLRRGLRCSEATGMLPVYALMAASSRQSPGRVQDSRSGTPKPQGPTLEHQGTTARLPPALLHEVGRQPRYRACLLSKHPRPEQLPTHHGHIGRVFPPSCLSSSLPPQVPGTHMPHVHTCIVHSRLVLSSQGCNAISDALQGFFRPSHSPARPPGIWLAGTYIVHRSATANSLHRGSGRPGPGPRPDPAPQAAG